VLLQLKRGAQNIADKDLKRFPRAVEFAKLPVIAESKTALWTEAAPAEQFLQAGKIQNLRIAVKNLHGIEIPAGAVFSFWKHLGRANRARGYVEGRELREGCIIPNVGGGLCQISNALYDAALQSNFEIVERYAHSQVIAGSAAEEGRDATVFWNYVDLRFRAPFAYRIEATLDAENLTVKFKSAREKTKQLFTITKMRAMDGAHPNSCASCGVDDCFRVVKPSEKTRNFGRVAYLLDEHSPELDEYIAKQRTKKDVLFIPIDGKRFRKANYAWATDGYSKVNQHFRVTAERAYRSRKLAAQGAARQLNLLSMAEKLAHSYAAGLKYDALHLVIQQNLLPYLWRSGHLGGRTFDVLMTALPMHELQKRLDHAKSLHPESKTLGDFRADETLIKAEKDALANARKIITPHSDIAALFADRAELLDWKIPVREPRIAVKNTKPKIVFPATTVGRKGAYELREAVRGLDVTIITVGPQIEGADFWQGFDTENRAASNGWLDDASMVVLPAFVEHKPRRLIEAAARKIPVIASEACGVSQIDGVETIEAGSAENLREKIIAIIN
jgi:glycosyltransferase involved in cell wall biosynthesis